MALLEGLLEREGQRTMTTSAEVAVAEGRTYTMRELSQATAKVIDEINSSERPALVTKHGRFVALITPMANASIESVVFRRNGAEIAALIREADSDDESYSPDDVRAEIKIDL